MEKHYRLGYRPDIEGMRAIAILLVVAVHAGVKQLPGGFIGVDAFYILSGYLITGLLVQEAVSTGRLNFARFYGRRLLRLLPALVLMIVITCFAAWLVMPPTTLPSQASNAISATLWLSNFQYAYWNLDYFAPTSQASLFLHTWSLGVEEQFYLLWPLLVLLAVVVPVSMQSSAAKKLAVLFGIILVASFGLSLYWSYRSPMLAFYLMPSRAWQFALGGLTLLATRSTGYPKMNRVAIRCGGWAGLAMILTGAAVISPVSHYPGIWGLMPSVGTSLMLLAGAAETNVGVARLLGWMPFQSLGKVSYSWYLWHWPILLLGGAVLDTSSGLTRLLLVLLSLGVAALSYHYFETPIRHKRDFVSRPGLAIMASLVVMALVVIPLRAWQQQSVHNIRNDAALKRFTIARTDRPSVDADKCFGSTSSTRADLCVFGDAGAPHLAVLLGDSKAFQWYPAIKPLFENGSWKLMLIGKSGCPLTMAPVVDAKLRRMYFECTEWRADAVRKVKSLEPDVLILSESVSYPFSRSQWIRGTSQILKSLSSSAKHVYLIRPTPELPFNGPSCAEPRGRVYNMLVGPSHCTAQAHSKRFDDVGRWLENATAPFPSAEIADMTEAVCPEGVCRSEVNGMIVFADDAGHLTATFARSLTGDLAKVIGPDHVRKVPRTDR